MLLNLNQILTAKKLILEEKKNLQPEKKKNNYQLCKKCTCTAPYVMKHN